MKDKILNLVNEYLLIFPEEKPRQKKLIDFLNKYSDEEITDWNNFNGHIVASGFVYSKKEQKFLVMYHNDMKIFTYPGGHIDKSDKNPLEAATREVKEETGITKFEALNISKNNLIPIDIDTHMINYNERLNLPEHLHFDFRYLFLIDEITDVEIDHEELSSFKWITKKELENNQAYGKIINKIRKMI